MNADTLSALHAGARATVVFDDGRNDVVLGTAARNEVINNEAHIHPDFNETWIIPAGEVDFGIGDYPSFRVSAGDIVLSPAGMVYLQTSASDETSIRLALTKHGSDHSIPGPRGLRIRFRARRDSTPSASLTPYIARLKGAASSPSPDR